ncbi:MAG: hypothetical protein ACTSSK_15995 [Candidatus Heimdallarchaeota archaeon]
MTQEVEITDTIMTKKYRWSLYSFIVNAVSFTTLTALIVILMIMHRVQDPTITLENWVIIVIGISCEVVFLLGSFFDARRRDPKERMFSSTIFNLPFFAIITIVTCLSSWGWTTQLALTYGALTGAFAGYLSGALAYGTFFVKIKNAIYRTIYGGWIAIPAGAIAGYIFALTIDPLGGGVFGGIFMGFWGGTLSGILPTVTMYVRQRFRKLKAPAFFTKLQYYDIQKELTIDIENHFKEGAKELNLEECKFFQDEVKKKREKLTNAGSKAIIVLLAMNFMLGLFIFVLPKLIRGLAFFMSPWEERDENRIRKSYLELIDFVIEPLGLTREDNIIKPLE